MRHLLLIPVIAAFGCAHTTESAAGPTASISTEGQFAIAPAPPAKIDDLKPMTLKEPSLAATPPVKPDEGASAPKVAAAPPVSGRCGAVRVHFAFDSSKLEPNATQLLERSSACLKANPHLRVTIEGNADERGSVAYNEKLGEARARTVAQFLESRGVATDQLTVISNGKEKPVCNGHEEACWERNRRTAIRDACRL